MSAQETFETTPLPDIPGVSFGRSADGMPVARIGDLAFAMVPGRDGHFLASAWRVPRPLDQLRRDDFYSHHGALADEAAFRARMSEQAEHSRELKALSRQVSRISCSTPWGPSQTATTHADGIVEHSTAEHGGFHRSMDRNAQVHPLLRSEGAGTSPMIDRSASRGKAQAEIIWKSQCT